MPLTSGDYIAASYGTYSVVKPLCEGGMGRIFLGNSSLGEKVIIKEPRFVGDGDDPIRLEKLKVEAQILSKINHKNVVRFIDSRDEGTIFYLVLEFVPGRSMKDTYWKKPAGEDETKQYILTLLNILQYIHKMNVIHRDIKPHNILMPSDIVLLDFGSAKHGYTQLLSFGHTIVGTPGWSAPEQFSGLVTPRCDIFSVGATMFFLLTGHPPNRYFKFDARGAYDGVQSPRKVNPRVSKEMAKVVLTAMDPDASNRFQIADEMKNEIMGRRIARGGPPCIFCKGKKYPVTKTLKIGRSPQCDVYIEDPQLYVSRGHAEIYIEGGKYWIEDVGSRNGTFVHEKGRFQRITKRELRANDLVALCYSPQKGPYITLSFSLSA